MSHRIRDLSDDDLRAILTSQQPSHLDYSGAKFEWDRRQEIKKVRRWRLATAVAVLTLVVLIASFVVQYRAWRDTPQAGTSTTVPAPSPAPKTSPSP